MGLTLTFTGSRPETWPLTGKCIEQIERLRSQGYGVAVQTVFGPAEQQLGEPFFIDSATALASLALLLPLAKRLPNGFEVWSPSLYGEVHDSGARGVGGLLIDGQFYSIRCDDNYWALGHTRDLLNSHAWPRQYEPCDVQTDNHRVYQVKAKKGRSDVSKLLGKLQIYLEGEHMNVVNAVVG